MTKEESLAWVKSLKPGDIVIYSGFGVAGRIQTAKVEKSLHLVLSGPIGAVLKNLHGAGLEE